MTIKMIYSNVFRILGLVLGRIVHPSLRKLPSPNNSGFLYDNPVAVVTLPTTDGVINSQHAINNIKRKHTAIGVLDSITYEEKSKVNKVLNIELVDIQNKLIKSIFLAKKYGHDTQSYEREIRAYLKKLDDIEIYLNKILYQQEFKTHFKNFSDNSVIGLQEPLLSKVISLLERGDKLLNSLNPTTEQYFVVNKIIQSHLPTAIDDYKAAAQTGGVGSYEDQTNEIFNSVLEKIAYYFHEIEQAVIMDRSSNGLQAYNDLLVFDRYLDARLSEITPNQLSLEKSTNAK